MSLIRYRGERHAGDITTCEKPDGGPTSRMSSAVSGIRHVVMFIYSRRVSRRRRACLSSLAWPTTLIHHDGGIVGNQLAVMRGR